MPTYIIGAILAIISIFIIAKIYPNKDHAFWRVGLIIAAVIYVGFALFAQSWEHIPMELAGVALYGLFAFLSKRYALYWLGLGWLFHVGWDLFLPMHQHGDFVPVWYLGVCLGFDIVRAIYIFYLYWKRKAQKL